MWLINDFRDFEYMSRLFPDAKSRGWIGDYELKVSYDIRALYYGLFDHEDKLVAYNWLMRFGGVRYTNLWRGHEFHVADHLTGKGLGFLIYQHIIVTDGLTLVSDLTHTTPTAKIWKRLQQMPNVRVGTYDSNSDTLEFADNFDPATVYNNSHIHFAAQIA